ncbi:MAG: NAD(P)-binding domain-containing protein [Microbacteriaceae bacterium]
MGCRRHLTPPHDTTNGDTIGIIGSGNFGGALARAFTKSGYRVVVSNSRGRRHRRRASVGGRPRISHHSIGGSISPTE